MNSGVHSTELVKLSFIFHFQINYYIFISRDGDVETFGAEQTPVRVCEETTRPQTAGTAEF